MRVVHYYPPASVGDGGVKNSVRRLTLALTAAGADTAVAVNEWPPRDPGGIEWIRVRHVGVGPTRVPVDFGRALAGTDLLVLNSAWMGHNVRAGAAAHAAGIPYVLAPRGAYDPNFLDRKALVKRAWWAAFERRLVERAVAVHVFFASQRTHVEGLGYRGKLLVAPNGVAAPAGLTWDGGTGGYILYLGRFDPEHKGLDLLVRAVAALPPAERPALRLHGPDFRGGKQRLDALVGRLGLRQWVTLGPEIVGGDKWKLFARAVGFVYPSRWEGFGNSLAEAAALGVPSLATPYPLSEHLAARGASLVVQPTPAALAEGLTALRAPGAGEMGRRAAEVVREEFTWEEAGRTWLKQAEALI